MLFVYTTVDNAGTTSEGTIDAANKEVAISALQRRGLTIASIVESEKKGGFLDKNFKIFERVKGKDIVILSRQMATLFEAQVSALRIFRLLGEQAENDLLRRTLTEISDDLQGGNSISKSLAKHPKVFSEFYVNMVLAGEESGKLDQTFQYLADYLDRTYAITAKAKNAFIYPAFIVMTMFAVMILMFTMVIPRISSILLESGQAIPFYTRFMINISTFFVQYGIILGVLAVIGGYFLFRYLRTASGKATLSRFKLSMPYVKILYHKLYLSRICDNMNTMILAGISMVRVLEITASVVDNDVYRDLILQSADAVRGGSTVSGAFALHGDQIPGIMVQMMRVGEETGELGAILKTLSKFYDREVESAVDTLVDLIEPVMIVSLAVGVGFLLVSVLVGCPPTTPKHSQKRGKQLLRPLIHRALSAAAPLCI